MSRATAGRIGVGAAWLLGFGWQVYGALTNLVFFTGLASAARAELSAFAWAVLVSGLVVPVLAFVVGTAVGIRRSPAGLALVLLAAFCASEALTLSVLAVFQTGSGVT